MDMNEEKATRGKRMQPQDDGVKKITDAEMDEMARVFGEKVKTMPKRVIKIPQKEGADQVVPVVINGYFWQIKRGERLEVPEIVAHVLEEADII